MSGPQKRVKKARPQPAMNVTPLVDVVLVLLIIFMVVIPAMEKGARVELASIFNVDEEASGRTDPVNLALTLQGTLHLDDQELPVEQLESRLTALHTAEPMRRIVLRADRGVHYEKARDLFRLCQTIGFPGISLQVNERNGGRQDNAPRAAR